jgi:hypothetical protein
MDQANLEIPVDAPCHPYDSSFKVPAMMSATWLAPGDGRTIGADAGFGIKVWGYDSAASYGYPAGASVEPIDTVFVPTTRGDAPDLTSDSDDRFRSRRATY